MSYMNLVVSKGLCGIDDRSGVEREAGSGKLARQNSGVGGWFTKVAPRGRRGEILGGRVLVKVVSAGRTTLSGAPSTSPASLPLPLQRGLVLPPNDTEGTKRPYGRTPPRTLRTSPPILLSELHMRTTSWLGDPFWKTGRFHPHPRGDSHSAPPDD